MLLADFLYRGVHQEHPSPKVKGVSGMVPFSETPDPFGKSPGGLPTYNFSRSAASESSRSWLQSHARYDFQHEGCVHSLLQDSWTHTADILPLIGMKTAKSASSFGFVVVCFSIHGHPASLLSSTRCTLPSWNPANVKPSPFFSAHGLKLFRGDA